MQQLELFPKDDIVRFAMSFSTQDFGILKSNRPEDYYRIQEIRKLVHKHNADVRHLEKRFAFDIDSLINRR